jgi:hypothetical protein
MPHIEFMKFGQNHWSLILIPLRCVAQTAKNKGFRSLEMSNTPNEKSVKFQEIYGTDGSQLYFLYIIAVSHFL